MVYSHWAESRHGLGSNRLYDNVWKFSHYTGNGIGAGTYYPQLPCTLRHYYYADIVHVDKY